MTLIMMVTVSTTISSQTHQVYTENKAKELCSEYDEECIIVNAKLKMMEIKQIMRVIYNRS